MNTDTIVPYRPVSEERKLHLESLLRTGNVLLKEYHEQMKIKNKIKKHSRTLFLNLIYNNARPNQNLIIKGVEIPSVDLDKILKIKQVEEEVICAYANLINKLSQKWHKEKADVALSLEDLRAEAYQAAISAISHFTKDVRLSTFIHHCIQRHMSRIYRTSNGLSSLSDNSARLKSEYSNLSSEEGATFDSIVDKMKISEKEVATLCSVLAGVQNLSSLEKEEKTTLSIIDDYEEPEFENNILSKIKEIEFSDLEKAVLEGVLNSSSNKLGIGSLCKNLINPNTNKPYSRMAFSLAWKRVKQKVIDAYKNVA